MDRYGNETSYLTYMQMGIFRPPLGIEIWRQEAPSKHTNSAIFFNNNMSLWTGHKVPQRRQGSNGHSRLRSQKSTLSASMGLTIRVQKRLHNIPHEGVLHDPYAEIPWKGGVMATP